MSFEKIEDKGAENSQEIGADSNQFGTQEKRSTGTGFAPNENPTNPYLGHDFQNSLEKSFGESFANLNVYKNSAVADKYGASGLAQDNAVHLGTGKFNTTNKEGKQLIAHEIAHLLQQRNSHKGTITTDNQSEFTAETENEADEAANKVLRGEKVNIKKSAPANASQFYEDDFPYVARIISTDKAIVYKDSDKKKVIAKLEPGASITVVKRLIKGLFYIEFENDEGNYQFGFINESDVSEKITDIIEVRHTTYKGNIRTLANFLIREISAARRRQKQVASSVDFWDNGIDESFILEGIPENLTKKQKEELQTIYANRTGRDLLEDIRMRFYHIPGLYRNHKLKSYGQVLYRLSTFEESFIYKNKAFNRDDKLEILVDQKKPTFGSELTVMFNGHENVKMQGLNSQGKGVYTWQKKWKDHYPKVSEWHAIPKSGGDPIVQQHQDKNNNVFKLDLKDKEGYTILALIDTGPNISKVLKKEIDIRSTLSAAREGFGGQVPNRQALLHYKLRIAMQLEQLKGNKKAAVQRERLKKAQTHANKMLSTLQSSTIVPVKAVYIPKKGPQAGKPINLPWFAGIDRDNFAPTVSVHSKLLDFFPGADGKSTYEGAHRSLKRFSFQERAKRAIVSAILGFDSNNVYPPGTVYIRFELGGRHYQRKVITNGKTTYKQFADAAGWLSMASFIGGILTTPFPVISGPLFYLSMGLGATSSLGNIMDNLSKDDPNFALYTADMLDLISNLLPLAKAGKLLKGKKISFANNQLYEQVDFGLGFTRAVILTGDGVVRINKILGDPTLTDDQRQAKLIEIASELLLNHSMFGLSTALADVNLPQSVLEALESVEEKNVGKLLQRLRKQPDLNKKQIELIISHLRVKFPKTKLKQVKPTKKKKSKKGKKKSDNKAFPEIRVIEINSNGDIPIADGFHQFGGKKSLEHLKDDDPIVKTYAEAKKMSDEYLKEVDNWENGTKVNAEKPTNPAADIYRKTGWIMDQKGGLRYEFSSEKAKLKTTGNWDTLKKLFNTNTSASYQLDKILDYEQLYKRYPAFKNFQVKFEKFDDELINVAGQFSKANNSITINLNHFNKSEEILKFQKRKEFLTRLNKKEGELSEEELSAMQIFIEKGAKYDTNEYLTGTLIHEIQHKIQTLEGLAEGSSPRPFKKLLTDILTSPKLAYNPDYKDLIQGYRDAMSNDPEGLDKILQGLSVKMYKNVMGEQTAFASQKRLRLTMKELLDDPFEFDEVIKMESVLSDLRIHFQNIKHSNDKVIKGLYSFDGNMYINKTKATPDTKIHEYGHVWLEIGDRIDNVMIDSVMAEAMATKRFKSLKNSTEYGHLDDRSLVKEVLAFEIGNLGVELVNKSSFKKIIDWIAELLAKLTGGNKVDLAKKILNDDLSVNDLVLIAAKEVTGKKRVAKGSQQIIDFILGNTNTIELDDTILKQLGSKKADDNLKFFSLNDDIVDATQSGNNLKIGDYYDKNKLAKLKKYRAEDVEVVEEFYKDLKFVGDPLFEGPPIKPLLRYKEIVESEKINSEITKHLIDADPTGFDNAVLENIVDEARNHLFIKEHLVLNNTGSNPIWEIGRFSFEEYKINLWYKFFKGHDGPEYNRVEITNEDVQQFKSLIVHEYIESRLMNSGILYRNIDESVSTGAHNLSINEGTFDFSHYGEFGLDASKIPTLNADFSNIDEIVEAIIKLKK